MGAFGDNFYSWLSSGGIDKVVDDEMPGKFDKSKHPRGQPENKGQFRQGMKSITKQDEVSSDKDTIMLPDGKKIDASLKTLYTDDKGKLVSFVFSPFLKRLGRDGKVSDSMEAALTRLFGGEDVGDAEIEKIPEWREAMERERRDAEALKGKYGIERTSEIDTPERNKLRSDIIETALTDTISKTVPVKGQTGLEFETNEGLKDGESYKVEKGRKAFVCIGFPAAGKSTTFANPLAKRHRARLCDSDTIKKVLPEFDNGYGGNLVHDESTQINEAILGSSVKNGDNVVYPILGYKPDKLRRLIGKFHENGYKVAICFKDMPKTTAKGRLLVRFLQKGRYLPLSCISKVGDALGGSFANSKTDADAYMRTTNKKPYGGTEETIEAKGEI